MLRLIRDIIIALLISLGLTVTFNPDLLFFLGLLHPEEATQIVVEGK